MAERGPSGTGHDTAPHPRKLEDAALSLSHRAEYVADHIMDNGLAPRLQMLRDAVLDVRREVERARNARRPDPPVAVPGPASEPHETIRRDFDLLQAQVGADVGYETSQGPLGRIWRDRAALLAVGERDKAEIAELRGELAVAYGGPDPDGKQREWFSALDRAKAEIVALREAGERDRQQIARLTEALRFYADKSKWNYRIGGKQARATYVSYRLAEEALRDVAVLAGEEDAG